MVRSYLPTPKPKLDSKTEPYVQEVKSLLSELCRFGHAEHLRVRKSDLYNHYADLATRRGMKVLRLRDFTRVMRYMGFETLHGETCRCGSWWSPLALKEPNDLLMAPVDEKESEPKTETSPAGHSPEPIHVALNDGIDDGVVRGIRSAARKAVDVSDMTKLSPEVQRAEIEAIVDARLSELGFGPLPLSDGFCPSLPSETKAGEASSLTREGGASFTQDSSVGLALEKLTKVFDEVLTAIREGLPQADQKKVLSPEALIAQPSEGYLSNG